MLATVPLFPPGAVGRSVSTVVQRRVTENGRERTDGGAYRVRTGDRKKLYGGEDSADPKPEDLYAKGQATIADTE